MGGAIEVVGRGDGDFAGILTADALAFVAGLHRRFNPEREARLAARAVRQERLDASQVEAIANAASPDLRTGQYR